MKRVLDNLFNTVAMKGIIIISAEEGQFFVPVQVRFFGFETTIVSTFRMLLFLPLLVFHSSKRIRQIEIRTTTT